MDQGAASSSFSPVMLGPANILYFHKIASTAWSSSDEMGIKISKPDCRVSLESSSRNDWTQGFGKRGNQHFPSYAAVSYTAIFLLNKLSKTPK